MLAGTLLEGVQCKVTGPAGTIRKCALTEEHQKSWLALEQEIKTLHGLNGPVSVNYLDEDNDQILIDSDGELATLLKWVAQTKATSIKMIVNPAFPSMLPDQYNSTNSMASFRTQDSFSGVIPTPEGAFNSTDSWRYNSQGLATSFSSQQQRPLSQAMDYSSQGSFTSEYNQPQHTERTRQDSDASKLADSKINSIAREAAYKAAIEANNAARRAFEESKQAARANREQQKSSRRTGGSSNDNLPAYE
ncbi:UNVERIFIED_CONTAM: hypothetical protein HDU68_008703 [Siphonaria sp. JEL0065]|nr:hypothetical protein HDU68_008703 [Siphonaria sp. JEL0065]